MTSTMTRSAEAVQRVRAGESATAVARDMGLTRDAIYKEMRRQRARAEKVAAAQAALARAKRHDEARRARDRSEFLNDLRQRADTLPGGRGPDGATWVRLADVLQLLTP